MWANTSDSLYSQARPLIVRNPDSGSVSKFASYSFGRISPPAVTHFKLLLFCIGLELPVIFFFDPCNSESVLLAGACWELVIQAPILACFQGH